LPILGADKDRFFEVPRCSRIPKPLLLGRNFEEGIHGEAADFVVEKAFAEP
jgi:hypothetical protein